ncbi:MAG: hypothetical protein ACFBSC_20800 [Microcoleaceae cyanobacterium]
MTERKKPGPKPRDKARVQLVLSPEGKKALQAKAKALGMTSSALVEELVGSKTLSVELVHLLGESLSNRLVSLKSDCRNMKIA